VQEGEGEERESELGRASERWVNNVVLLASESGK
jgi:hypothetical protein